MKPEEYTIDGLREKINRYSVPCFSKDNIFDRMFRVPWQKKFRPKGVYLMGDFYVGQSTDIHLRIRAHQRDVTKALNKDFFTATTMIDGVEYWIKSRPGISIPVFWLSEDMNSEYDIAVKLKKHGFPIINSLAHCKSYGEYHLKKKEIQAKKYLESLGYTVIMPEERKQLKKPLT